MARWLARLLPRTPPRTFAAVSLLLIVATLIATSTTQSRFFRDAVIDREEVIVRDMVHALALRELQPSDLEHYTEAAAQQRFARTFGVLKNLSGVVRIKVFDRAGTIIWSDEPRLIGTHGAEHDDDLGGAIHGETRAVIDPANRPSHAGEGLPDQALIEFYVPFVIARTDADDAGVGGAFALYRSASELNFTIRRGMVLLWLVAGLGGAVLFGALYGLFHSVYRRQRAAESRFAKLSGEHERIVQMEKLSAMGRMLGEIAHQFNNPLVGVVNLAQLAEREAEDPARVRALLGDIRKAGDDCHSLVQRMLRFTQLARSEPQPAEIGALVRDTIAFFGQSVREGPAVAFDAPAEPVVLQVDPVLMRHALFNLINNASQADPDGPIRVELVAEAADGVGGWAINVIDRGPGLSPEAMKHLFTPFFTTRTGGTGLGLSVAQHIAVQHGGRLRAMNAVGGGAHFKFWLPAEDANETEDPAR